MSREIFGRLRQMLMEQLDLSRELSDKEILDVNDRTGVIHVMVDKKTTRFISKTGEQLTPEAADESDRLSRTDAAGQGDSREYYDSDGYTSFKEKGKYGFKDGMGKVVISPRYKDVLAEFSEDRAFVKNEKGKIVAVDGSGRELFQNAVQSNVCV